MTGAITQALEALEWIEHASQGELLDHGSKEAGIAHADLKKFVEGVPEGLKQAAETSTSVYIENRHHIRVRAAKHLQQGIEE